MQNMRNKKIRVTWRRSSKTRQKKNFLLCIKASILYVKITFRFYRQDIFTSEMQFDYDERSVFETLDFLLLI